MLRMGTKKTLKTYLARVNNITSQSGKFIFRGQANSDWKVECGASFRLRKLLNTSVDKPLSYDSILNYHNDELLSKLKTKRFKEYKDLNNMEIIADLQHRGAATLLIDFTSNALVALYFACLPDKKKNGAVFIANSTKFSRVSDSKLESISMDIENMIREKEEDRLYWWEPSQINNRISAQDSIFIFGNSIINDSYFEEKIVIAQSAKEEILEHLDQDFNINGSMIYNDLDGFVKTNSRHSLIAEYEKYEERSHITLLVMTNEYKEALIVAEKYADKYTQDVFGHYAMGFLNAVHLDNPEEAIKGFTKAIELKPNFKEAYLNRGVAKDKSGDWVGAIVDYNKAIQLKPDYAQGYVNLGNVKLEDKDWDGAIKDFTKAIELKPDYPKAYTDRARAYIGLGENDKAQRDLKKVHMLGYFKK